MSSCDWLVPEARVACRKYDMLDDLLWVRAGRSYKAISNIFHSTMRY
jgi:hypothetical protein